MKYMSGFANHHVSEAIQGALPQGQNSPKVPVQGLVPEQLSGTAFTMPRTRNLKTWLYRIHPSTVRGPFRPLETPNWISTPQSESMTPEALRWLPLAKPTSPCEWWQGIHSMAVTMEKAVAVHHYACNQSMKGRYLLNADAEMIILPQQGELVIRTEMGVLEVAPLEIVVIPRGVKFQVALTHEGELATGYLAENMGHPFVLPDLGPLGANGLAHERDFLYPVAAYEDKKTACQVIVRHSNRTWVYEQGHSPLDVVAWRGNYAPYKYDLRKFNTMGSVSYDHPDPSIYTVLTSPSHLPGTANLDFVIFPPRWLVAEETFRPPYYHRNVMSEYMGLLHGVYDAKLEGGFLPGGASLHNAMVPHGPDTETFLKAIKGGEAPQKIDDTMAFMFESCHMFCPTTLAMTSPSLDRDYLKCWQGFSPLFSES